MELCKTTYPDHPERTANIINKFSFWWLLDVVKARFKREIKEEDIYEVLNEHDTKLLGDKLESAWCDELNKIKLSGKPSLLNAVWKTFWPPFVFWSCVGFVTTVILRVGHVYLLSQLVEYFTIEGRSFTIYEACSYSGALIFSMLICNFLTYRQYHALNCIGMKVRVACSALIYRKIMKLKNTSSNHGIVGHIVTLMTSDVQHFDTGTVHIPYIVIGPLQILTSGYVCWLTSGNIAFIGIGFLIFIALLGHLYSGQLFSNYKPKLAKKTSQRVKIMSEIISGIQVIKMYAWERAFSKVVHRIRSLEINYLRKVTFLSNLLLGQSIVAERICLFIVLVLCTLMGNHVTAKMAYGLLQMYSTLKTFVIRYFNLGLISAIAGKVSLERTQALLLLQEISRDNTYLEYFEPNNDEALQITDGCAKWGAEQSENTLHDINLTVKKGDLCAIVGPVGSGKSSLLQVILAELPLVKGTMSIGGTISYASQDTWIFVGTVQQNILFGEAYDQKKYELVVEACALRRDFELFPSGDQTVIGERGISLSGGQRARINLARAVYRDSDIYLFDDPLSAVDTRVGSHLFEKCIKTYLASKTRVIVTHQLQYLKEVDYVVILSNGRIETQGPYEEVVPCISNIFMPQCFSEILPEQEYEKDCKNNIQSNLKTTRQEHDSELQHNDQEEQQSGAVDWTVYLEYVKAGGSFFFLTTLLLVLILAQTATSGLDYFVGYWVNFEDNQMNEALNLSQNHTKNVSLSLNWNSPTTGDFLLAYGIIIAVLLFLTMIRCFIVTKFFSNVSQSLHDMMFENVLETDMTFFRVNPSGRTLNRFSSDIGTVDEKLMQTLCDSVIVGLLMIGIMINVFLVNIWTMLPFIICMALTAFILKVYAITTTSLKRVHCLTYSPLFTHVAQSLNGLTVIRSCGSREMVTKKFEHVQNRNTSCIYLVCTSTTALALWLEQVCVIWFAAIMLVFFLIPRENLNSTAGLALTQVLMMALNLQYALKRGFEALSNFTSVERIVEYKKLQKEDKRISKDIPQPWPSDGCIKFENVKLCYEESGVYVLQNLNFEISPMQKIGIVGRTGAGKSSLISALFQLANTEGKIYIDNINICSDVSLQHIRRNISIIPQEPVLFSAPLRYNLDPFREFTDAVLCNALEEVELKGAVKTLDFQVTEGGMNLSVGQRQLVCLARAILRNNKIIVLDEATANVDQETDAIIQKTIRNKFKDCTVITIAHRLNTIMDCDRVMVMDSGTLVEFDHPFLLLQNKSSYFYKYVHEMGEGAANNLYLIAEENYQASKFKQTSIEKAP